MTTGATVVSLHIIEELKTNTKKVCKKRFFTGADCA